MQKGNMHNSRYINNSFIKKEVTMFLNNAPKKLLKKYPITDLIYITHDCFVYKSEQTNSGNLRIIKITPYVHKQHCILKAVSHINDTHLLTPVSVEKYQNFTVSVYPYKLSVIDKIIYSKLCFDELLTLALDLCDGIIRLHSSNILHLDISPNNIYLNDDNTFCIGDFSSSQKKSNNKIRRNIYFTEGYSPPEFKAYSKNLVQINELSDEYSLAKTILSLCHGYNTSAKDHPVQNTTDIPEYFFDILNKASSEIQEYRYPSINAFKTELLSFKAKYDISEIKYYISFNSENNPFNNTKTRPMAKPHIEEPTPAIQKIINSPAFMTVAILLAVILPILSLYKIFYTPNNADKIAAHNIQNISISYETKEPVAIIEENKTNNKNTNSAEIDNSNKNTDSAEIDCNDKNTNTTKIDCNDNVDNSKIKKDNINKSSVKEIDIEDKNITSLSEDCIKSTLNINFDISSVTIISANNNNISDISRLSEFVSARELYLSDNRIKNIDSLKQLFNLKTLVISSNLIDDITSLKELKNLENLDISNNKKLKNLSALYELKTLKLLCINETAVTKGTIKKLKVSLPDCEIIY
jgi:serine/threonine protein kinase